MLSAAYATPVLVLALGALSQGNQVPLVTQAAPPARAIVAEVSRPLSQGCGQEISSFVALQVCDESGQCTTPIVGGSGRIDVEPRPGRTLVVTSSVLTFDGHVVLADSFVDMFELDALPPHQQFEQELHLGAKCTARYKVTLATQ